MSPKQAYYKITAEKVINEFSKRNIKGYYCENKEKALEKALELIEENSTVTWGGSQSIFEIGLTEKLINGNYNVIDRSSAKTNQEIKDVYRKAFSADYYLMSSNAITLDGKLVNIDGNGNRVACLVYGPDNVIIIAGMNKIAKDENEALSRVRNVASPINTLRLNRNTPCTKTGSCHDCTSDDCICCQVVITRFSRQKDRIKVILVGEELGY